MSCPATLRVESFLLAWPIFKEPVLHFVQRTVDHETTSSLPAGPTAPKACDLLTADIVTPVLGTDATLTQSPQALCGYQSSPGSARALVGNWSTMKPPGNQQPVPGVGDEAWISGEGVYVRKGLLGLRISLSAGLFSGTDADTRQGNAEKAIAQQLLPKL